MEAEEQPVLDFDEEESDDGIGPPMPAGIEGDPGAAGAVAAPTGPDKEEEVSSFISCAA